MVRMRHLRVEITHVHAGESRATAALDLAGAPRAHGACHRGLRKRRQVRVLDLRRHASKHSIYSRGDLRFEPRTPGPRGPLHACNLLVVPHQAGQRAMQVGQKARAI
eukprot:scaffold47379_cov67-Phaeocystis_antarctica.AAC.5